MLENPAAVGDRILQRWAPIDFVTKKPDTTKPYDSKYIKNDHQGIVDRETWDKAQERLKSERKIHKDGIYKTTKTNFMFGRIYCGECGELMTRRSIYYEGVMQKVWKCKDRNKGRKGNGCKCDVVSERELFEAVFRFIGKEWPGLDNVMQEDLDCVERIDVFNGRGIKITLKEKSSKASA